MSSNGGERVKKALQNLPEPKDCRFCKDPESVHYYGDDGTCDDCQMRIRELENNSLFSIGKHPHLD